MKDMSDDDRPPLEKIDTKQLMTARMLFTAMLGYLQGAEIPLEEATPENIESIEREIAEIDVELLSRDYQDSE